MRVPQEWLRNSSATETRFADGNGGIGSLGAWRRGFATIKRHNGGRAMTEQTFENHAKFVPSYHFFALPVFVINFVWSVYRLVKLGISFEGIFGVILAAAFVVLVFRARLFALGVQDRVIRLEQRVRYERVLPADLPTTCANPSIAQHLTPR